ncbi:MAG TPA: phosphoribosylglycinamide formyltransferase [Nitrososphaeraceae archaeon]|nr:phosphoribosylglycinamide formyltransferase [Nitrososphaeraceae archaeon]
MIKLAILISGRGTNMEAILTAIHQGRIRNAHPVIVLSNVQNANGLTIANKKFGVRTELLSNDDDGLKGWNYDKNILSILQKYKISPRNGLICLAGFMRLLSPKFVSIFRNRIINIHPSLLPSFPGLHAQRQALEYGVKISGCTVHFVDQGLDTGPIIIQKSTPVLETDTEETLSARILEDEHKIYPEAIRLISENRVKLLRRKVLVQQQ